jgi:hypothetical protein
MLFLVQAVQVVQAVQTPSFIRPRVAGEEREPAPDLIRGGGLNGWFDGLTMSGFIFPAHPELVEGLNGLNNFL